jgi:DNA-binding transcriptional LysR family regulator
MNDRLAALRMFVRVARTGSFSGAARELRTPQPTASRMIAKLEQDIGASLLTRTTRAVTLTEAGADFLARIEPILGALEEAEHAARGTGELRGVLRVASATSLAVRELVPRLPAFTARHPALRIEFALGDQRQDLIGEAVDVAIRLGFPPDPSAVARKLGVNQRLLAASPAYLARAGAPASPSELSSHALILGPPGQSADGWTFRKDGKVVSIRVEGRLRFSVAEAATAAAVAGLGVMSSGYIGCRRELETGLLVQVLPDWEMGQTEVNAVLPAGRAAKPAARAFVEFLREEFALAGPWIPPGAAPTS